VARLVELRDRLVTSAGLATGTQDLPPGLDAYRAAAKRIDPLLPRVVTKLPRIPYGVAPMIAAAGPAGPAADYRAPGADDRRPGWFLPNLQRAPPPSGSQVEALTAQYAMPGLHLPAALAAENDALSPLRRHQPPGAHARGWALYAAGLGEALELYDDLPSRLGRLDLELEHALALVVDTGLHALGWERAQAIAYLAEHLPRDDEVLAAVVDRHLARPGEALADALGAETIGSLRARAEARLGDVFSLREFHDALLAVGQLPLDLLEAHIETWIQRRLDGRDGDTP
jgi:uncharacterized protein (DUF885 family)